MEESKGKMRKLMIIMLMALLLLSNVGAYTNVGYGQFPFIDLEGTSFAPDKTYIKNSTDYTRTSLSEYAKEYNSMIVWGDIDNNDLLDIVLINDSDSIAIFNATGLQDMISIPSGYDITPVVGLAGRTPALFDWDSDGKLEIIIPAINTGANKSALLVYGWSLSGGATLEKQVNFSDTSNDVGNPICKMFGSDAHCYWMVCAGYDYMMDYDLTHDTNETSQLSGGSGCRDSQTPVMSDIDNDGYQELITRWSSGIIKWELDADGDMSANYTTIYNVGLTTYRFPPFVWGDYVVALTYRAVGDSARADYTILYPNGTVASTLRFQLDGDSGAKEYKASKPVIMDIDNNGHPDLCGFVNIHSGTYYQGYFKCWSDDFTLMVDELLPISSYYFNDCGDPISTGAIEATTSNKLITWCQDVYEIECQGIECSSHSDLVSVFSFGEKIKGSASFANVDNDGYLDLVTVDANNLDIYSFGQTASPTGNKTLNVYVEDYDTLSPVDNYKLYDILNGTSYYTNASGKVIISGLPDNVKFFGQKSNYFYYVGLNITMSDTVTGISLFPYNTASVTFTEVSDNNYTLNITVFETQTFLDTYLRNGTTAIPNSPIYSMDYDITFNTQALGDLTWALVDGTYNFRIVDYNINKLGVVKEGDTSVYWDISEGGGLALSQQCIDEQDLCLNPVIQNEELVCPLGASYECPLGCDDYRCNDCNWFGCVYDDEIYNASIPKSYYGWYVDYDNWSYQYQYNDSIKSNYITLGNVMFMQTSPVLGIELYNDIPDYVSNDWFMESKWLLPYNGAVMVNALDESNTTIFAYQLNSVDLNSSYVYVDEWNGTGWQTIINGSGGGIDIDEPFKVYVENNDGNCTIKLDTDLDGSYDYEESILCYSANEMDLVQIIPTLSYVAGISNDGFLAWDYFKVGKVSSETTCDSFEDDFNYGTSIQTGGGWYGDALYPQVGTNSDMQDALSQWYPALEDSDYDTAGLTLKHSSLNYIGHNTNCFKASQKLIMDYAILPYKAPPVQDKTWDYAYDIYLNSDSGEHLILRIEKSASSFWTPSGHKSTVSLWNGIGWVDSGIEIPDFDYHRLTLELDFNFNLARVRLDDATTLIDYEPIYLSNPTINNIEIQPSDIENADTLLWIDYIGYGVEGRQFNDRYTPTEAGTAEEDFNQQTGLQEHYSCGWNWTGGEGNYFDWSLCTPEEQSSHSTWCIIKVLGKCTIGNLTVWILNNVLFFLVLIILIALFVPFVIHRKKS